VSGSPLRVACCITELEPGGAERMLVELVTRVDRDAFIPIVISLGPTTDALVARLQADSVEVHCLDVPHRWDVRSVRRLGELLKVVSPDVLQTWLLHANVAGCLAARRAGIGSVLTGIRVAESRGRWRLWLERWATRRATRHVCVSNDVAEFCRTQAGLRPEKIVVIDNGVDASRFIDTAPMDLSAHGIPGGAEVVAWIGRLDEQKDPGLAVQVMRHVVDTRPGCHLVMAGEGAMRERLVAEVARHGLEERVHLVGYVDSVPGLLRSASVLLLTSRWEGMPNVVLEAMATALPVVTTCVEGVNDLIKHGETGLVVGNRDPATLASAVLSVLGDSNGEMGEAALRRATGTFSMDRMVKAYESLWAEVYRQWRDGDAAC